MLLLYVQFVTTELLEGQQLWIINYTYYWPICIFMPYTYFIITDQKPGCIGLLIACVLCLNPGEISEELAS